TFQRLSHLEHRRRRSRFRRPLWASEIILARSQDLLSTGLTTPQCRCSLCRRRTPPAPTRVCARASSARSAPCCLAPCQTADGSRRLASWPRAIRRVETARGSFARAVRRRKQKRTRAEADFEA